MSSAVVGARLPQGFSKLLDDMNSRSHRVTLWFFMAVVVAHWAEHLAQAVQIWVLGWERPASKGVLGLALPWLVESETLHYAYAIIMLVGLVLLREAFVGTSRAWWNTALIIQFWHHFEHALLLGQAVVGANLLGRPVPTSIAQLIIPRVELHLLYNALVFIPMLIAMYYHVRPPAADLAEMNCTCAAHSPASAAARAT
ncbi:MAG: hypothetical protein ACRDVM_09385 [Acidimicrobiia bacterium]